MTSPVKYAVMDDYKRSINLDSPPHPAFLDGETHVRWKLEWRYTISEDATEAFGPEEIDIDEDRCIGLESGEPDVSRYDELNPQEATLLWEPLPLDIPTMKRTCYSRWQPLKAMRTGTLDSSAANRRRISPDLLNGALPCTRRSPLQPSTATTKVCMKRSTSGPVGPMLAAEKVTNTFYKEGLEKRAVEPGISDLWSTNLWIEPFEWRHIR
ncbi:hypothetical protein BDW75DRAFT_240959 [Aspergillus navahoensis]